MNNSEEEKKRKTVRELIEEKWFPQIELGKLTFYGGINVTMKNREALEDIIMDVVRVAEEYKISKRSGELGSFGGKREVILSGGAVKGKGGRAGKLWVLLLSIFLIVIGFLALINPPAGISMILLGFLMFIISYFMEPIGLERMYEVILVEYRGVYDTRSREYYGRVNIYGEVEEDTYELYRTLRKKMKSKR